MLKLYNIIFCITIFLSTGCLTLLERKILSIIGFRLGPNKPSIMGLMIFLYDAIKTFMKQTNMMMKFSFYLYYTNSMYMLFISLSLWSFLPSNPMFMNMYMSVLFIIMLMSMHTINMIIMGWSLNSFYSFYSIIRMIIQMISYELIMFIIIIMMLFNIYGMDLYMFNLKYYLFLFPIIAIIWFISSLMEMGRSPFDFPESESELISGFNIEYGSNIFSMLYLSEYMNILWMSMFSVILMINSKFMEIYIMIYYFIVILIRSMLPRCLYSLPPSWTWKFLLFFLTYIMLIMMLNLFSLE